MKEYVKSMREFIGHRPLLLCGAVVIVINEKNEVLMGHRVDNDSWGFTGGAIELDEVVEEAAKRELFEEAGLIAGKVDLFKVYSGPGLHYVYPNGDEVSNICIAYVCRDFSGSLKSDENENKEVRFFALDEIPTKISPPDVPIVEDIKAILKTV